MTNQELMDSLTKEQRLAIASVIRSVDVEGGYGRDDDGNSVWEEDTSRTLDCLAMRFEKYDPESVLDN